MCDLQKILDTMDIPSQRKTDWWWLWRNIGVRNLGHPHLQEARTLIKQKIAEEKQLTKDKEQL